MAQNASNYALELRDLRKSFGKTEIIRGANLAVNAGERVAIIGPNGAGKSTLFNLISGRFAPTSGEVILNGQRIDDLRIAIGAVGPVPERLSDIEDLLTGFKPTPASLRDASAKVADRVRSRSRQSYRREVLSNFVERSLATALAHAGLDLHRLPKETPYV